VNTPLKLAAVLIVVALALAVVGLVVRVLRWLLYVAVVVLLLAAAAKWLVGRGGDTADPAA
jgi:hypothetical protein